MTNNHEVKLSDFYQACILRTLGYPLQRLERDNAKFVTFVFDDPLQKSSQDLTDYWNRKTKVIARDLIDTISEIKTRLYSGY